LCHIHTDKEEIVCTPNHNILTEDGWKLANELTANDMIKTSTGFVQVLSIEIEHLEDKIKVYNLNVLGYHTYVVGNDLLVVHNDCHGNNLNCEKKNQLYNLIDENNQVVKIGKTTRGYKRYTKKYLRKNNLKMEFFEEGSKREIHNLQHQRLIEFFEQHGKLPKLNKSFW